MSRITNFEQESLNNQRRIISLLETLVKQGRAQDAHLQELAKPIEVEERRDIFKNVGNMPDSVRIHEEGHRLMRQIPLNSAEGSSVQ